jgi:uncharacterized protein YbjQ (UPF0145 family)
MNDSADTATAFQCTNSECGRIFRRSGPGKTCLNCGYQVIRIAKAEVGDQTIPRNPSLTASSATDTSSAVPRFECTNPSCGVTPTKRAAGNTCANCGYQVTEIRSRSLSASGSPLLVVTTNEVPGFEIIKVHGDVFGLTVRARNYFSNLGASFRTVVGGEVSGYTRLLADSRNDARGRLMDAARDLGANAVLGMRFDCNEIGGIMTEIAAYGTAVTLSPDPGGHPDQVTS